MFVTLKNERGWSSISDELRVKTFVFAGHFLLRSEEMSTWPCKSLYRQNCWSKKKLANHKMLLLKNWALNVQLTNCFHGQGWLLLLAKTITITILKVARLWLNRTFSFLTVLNQEICYRKKHLECIRYQDNALINN